MQVQNVQDISSFTPGTTNLKESLKNWLGAEEVFLTGRGASAIYASLKAIGKPGAYVAVPSHICPSVPSAIIHAGYQPWFADISTKDFNLNASFLHSIPGNTVAIIAPHIYGHPLEIDELVDFKNERGIILIEDIAHAAGESLNDRLLGTFGDIAIMSFHPSKLMNGAGGGAVIVNNCNLPFMDDLKMEIEQLPKAPYGHSDRADEISNKVNPLLNNAREGNNGERKIEKVYLQNLDLIPQKVNQKDEVMNLEAFNELNSVINERRERAENYESYIGNGRIKHPELENGSPLFRYTLLIDGKNGSRLRRRITSHLRANGIHASNLYYSAHQIFRWDSSKKLANSIWVQDRVINLWLDDIADEEYIQKTADLIDEVLD